MVLAMIFVCVIIVAGKAISSKIDGNYMGNRHPKAAILVHLVLQLHLMALKLQQTITGLLLDHCGSYPFLDGQPIFSDRGWEYSITRIELCFGRPSLPSLAIIWIFFKTQVAASL